MEPVETIAVTDGEFDHEVWRSRGAEIVARGRAANLQYEESRRVRDGSLWDLGDWLISGEKHLSAAYDEAVSVTKLSRGRLYNIVSIARAFPVSRRRENVHFSHYLEVATLAFSEKLQDRLLEYASKNELSVREMKGRVEYERKWALKEHTAKQLGTTVEEQAEKKKLEPKRIAVWLDPKSAKIIRLIARANKKQPGDVLFEWAHSYYTTNREAIRVEVRELEAKLKLERKQKNAEKPKPLNISKLFPADDKASPVTVPLNISVYRQVAL